MKWFRRCKEMLEDVISIVLKGKIKKYLRPLSYKSLWLACKDRVRYSLLEG